MKTKKPVLKPFALVASVLFYCALRLPAQTPPTITTQPASQTVLPGTNVTFTVAVSGTGPFTYQWQFNGTNLPNNIITTVAGNGSATYTGDGGVASNTPLQAPFGVTVDPVGNQYLADTDGSRVLRVGTDGVITTVAGSATRGSSGDGGAATNASLVGPTCVALDAAGNLYIADMGNPRLRKVDTNGIITTVAGGGTGGDGGAATNAALGQPFGVALDAAGNLYISDQEANCIRKVGTDGIITTVAGVGRGYSGDGGPATNASLSYPQGINIDVSGNLYIADLNNKRIRKVDTNGIITTVAGNGNGAYGAYSGDGGTATNASLSFPTSVGFDVVGNLYIADTGNNRIRQVDTNGIITTVAGSGPIFPNLGSYSGDGGPATDASLSNPSAVASDAVGNLYIADTLNNRIRRVCTNGLITTVAGDGTGGYSGDGSAATNAAFHEPCGVALDVPGNMYVADTLNNRIRKVDINGIITTVAGNGNGGYAGDSAAASNATLQGPFGLALDALGNLYIADTYNNVIRRMDASGVITTFAGNGTNGYFGDGGSSTNAGLNYPRGVALDESPNLYIADTSNNCIRKVDINGVITTFAGNGTNGYAVDGGAATNAALSNPTGVALDSAGTLFIADAGNNRIRRVDTNGVITTFAGNGTNGYSGDGGTATNASLNAPSGVVLDAFDNVYIADTGNNRVRKVGPTGIITTMMGNNSAAYAGDGGIYTNSSLNYPFGVASDAGGNLYVADTGNQRIRAVPLGGHPTLVLASVSANNAGNYSVIVTNSYGSVTSAVAILTVEAPPVMTVQPASQASLAGSSPSLSVVVGGSGPFEYLWYLAGTNLVQGGTNATLTLVGVATNEAGNYAVVVTNAWGSVTSQVATLTVVLPPSLTTQPASQTVLPGANVSFSVNASGTGPLTYQWQFNGVNLSNNIITTVAGNGNTGYSGDGGASTNADLRSPADVALDANGDQYIADSYNNRIRRVGTNGIIRTYAGNGNGLMDTGDGGPATSATVTSPKGVALDVGGNLYIADAGNRVRKVNTNGIITTVAGNGIATFAGDGGAATNASLSNPSAVALDAVGNLYIADAGNNRARKVDTYGIISTVAGNGSAAYSGDGGSATNAGLNSPSGVALDAAGNLYISDQYNERIRKVDTNGNISTVAGNGDVNFIPFRAGAYSGDGGAATNASLNNPDGVALDVLGNLYVADSLNARIREVDTNGLIRTMAGSGTFISTGDGGAATNAGLLRPGGITFDVSGNLYIADYANNRIRKVLLYAEYPTLSLANVGVSNVGNYSVIVTSAYGSVTSALATLTVQESPIITAEPASQIAAVGNSPIFSVAVLGQGPFGYLWYFDSTNLIQSATNNILTLPGVLTNQAGDYTVVVTNSYGSVTSQIARLSVGFAPSVITQPSSLTALPGNNLTLVVTAAGTGPLSYQWQFNGTNLPNGIITTVAGNGSIASAGDGGAATNASVGYPTGVALDAAGDFYIADEENSNVRKVDAQGIITTVAGLYSLTGVTVDSFGNIYIIDSQLCGIWRVPITSLIFPTFAGAYQGGYWGDGGLATAAALLYPNDAVFDASGNMYIADAGNNRARKVDTYGIISTVAGNGGAAYSGDGGAATNASLSNPTGVAMDFAGNLYIADPGNSRIRKVSTNGIITTVAGDGRLGFSGDGGAALNASVNDPFEVAVDENSNLFIADTFNDRIRMVDTNGIITTVAGGGAGSDGGAATNASLGMPKAVAVDITGNLYIADSANCRIRKVFLYAGYPTFRLFNLSLSNAGSYSVVITSPYGSVTSAVATLTVTIPSTPPQIITWDACFGFLTNQFGFNVTAAANQTIVVDGSTDLVNWTPLCTNTVGASAVYFCDPCWTNFGWRFYRARLP
jgi:sugar lactone lactonase YvrE